MDRWEYMMINPVAPMGEFAELGRRGWELCGFDHNGSAWFKRNIVKCELAEQGNALAAA